MEAGDSFTVSGQSIIFCRKSCKRVLKGFKGFLKGFKGFLKGFKGFLKGFKGSTLVL
jgi:hypothetical protein